MVLGVAAIVASVGAAYRYTISPKAADRMAEANRKYVPPVEKTLTPRQALLFYGSMFVVEVGAAFVLESVILAVFAVASAVLHAFSYRSSVERARARGGTRTPTSEYTGT